MTKTASIGFNTHIKDKHQNNDQDKS